MLHWIFHILPQKLNMAKTFRLDQPYFFTYYLSQGLAIKSAASLNFLGNSSNRYWKDSLELPILPLET